MKTPKRPLPRLRTTRLDLGPWHPADAAALDALRSSEPDRDGPMGWLAEAGADGLQTLRTDYARGDRNVEVAAWFFFTTGPAASTGPTDDLEAGTDAMPPPIAGGALRRCLGRPGFDVSVWVARPHRGVGYGTELAAALVRWAFEGFSAEVAWVDDARSPAGLSIARKLGFLPAAPGEETASDEAALLRLTRVDYPRSLAAALPVEAFDAAGQPIAFGSRAVEL